MLNVCAKISMESISSKSTESRLRIGLISPYLGANLGDAAILESARSHLLRLFPNADILFLVIDCERVSKLHGAEAFPLTAIPRPFYFTSVHDRTAHHFVQSKPHTTDAGSLRRRLMSALKKSARRMPLLLPAARCLRNGLGAITIEARHLLQARQIVRCLDGLIVAGGGQFDDVYGGPWGHPYAMFKWIILAESRRVPVFMVGVGVDALNHPLSRWFVRHTMAKVCRVSLRDAGSIEIMHKLGVERELIPSADLAFGFPQPGDGAAVRRIKPVSHFTIGLSPIAFGRPDSWPEDKKELFMRYWHEFQALAISLLNAGHYIRIFATDEADYPLAKMLYDQVTATASGRERIQLLPFLDLTSLLAVLRGLDAVVASRLHGVLLSHICRAPVLGISHLRKVRAHMEDMGQERFCLDFNTFTASEACRSLEGLLAEHDTVLADINLACADRYGAVEKEFAAIGAELALRSGRSPIRIIGEDSREK